MIVRLPLIFILASLFIIMSPAQAKELEQQLQHCTTITANNERLACYDQLTPLKTESVAATTPIAVASTAAPIVAAPVAVASSAQVASAKKADGFGKQHIKKTVVEADQSIIFTIAKLTLRNYDNWQITFENGQVWRQKDSKKIKLKTGDVVKLSKGFMSAIYLQKKDSNKRITVKRIK